MIGIRSPYIKHILDKCRALVYNGFRMSEIVDLYTAILPTQDLLDGSVNALILSEQRRIENG